MEKQLEGKREPRVYHHLRNVTMMYSSFFDGPNFHPFYEGTLEHNDRDVIYFLSKNVSTEKGMAELGIALSEVGIALCSNKLSRDENLLGSERFDHLNEAIQLFEKHGVPKKHWENHEYAASQALLNRFGNDAMIVVPGYVNAVTMGEYGSIISEIDIVPEREYGAITEKLRERGLEGVVNFWPE